MSLCKSLGNCFFFIGNRKGGGNAHLMFFLSFACLFPVFVKGESLVPEQANEVEESKRGAARSRGPREGTGEREKRNPPALGAVGHGRRRPAADRGLAGQRGQPRQRPQLGARALVMPAGSTAPFSGKKCRDGKPYSDMVYTEVTTTVMF